MKHLVYGVAFVAVLGLAPPLWAQTQANPPTTTTPSVTVTAPSPPPAASENRPKRQVRRARRYARPFPYYGGYGPWGSPSDHVANESNRAQLQGGWYGGGVPYPYAPYAPYAPQPYFPWSY
jgi:hypothetical protein